MNMEQKKRKRRRKGKKEDTYVRQKKKGKLFSKWGENLSKIVLAEYLALVLGKFSGWDYHYRTKMCMLKPRLMNLG